MMLSLVLHCSWLINELFLIRVDPAVELLEPLFNLFDSVTRFTSL